jgi:hypothetical protein
VKCSISEEELVSTMSKTWSYNHDQKVLRFLHSTTISYNIPTGTIPIETVYLELITENGHKLTFEFEEKVKASLFPSPSSEMGKRIAKKGWDHYFFVFSAK